MDTTSSLRSFLEIPYEELEELNLESKRKRASFGDPGKIKAEYLDYLKKEKRIKAVTLGFSDIEGRFHMLDYDKKFFISNFDNLTFDGSSIRGFSRQAESDLRLEVDWGSFWWLPSDVFGPGKVLIMGIVLSQDGSPYEMDARGLLKSYALSLKETKGYVAYAANEVEGFLLKGEEAEKSYNEREGFDIAAKGGYYHSLPNDILRIFIDRTAEAQRALGLKTKRIIPRLLPASLN
jgi:glutamine synthetase